MAIETFNLSIGQQKFFNNGRILLQALPNLESAITDALSVPCNLTTITRKPKNKPSYQGITAGSLNKALRNCINTIPNINGETHVENGIFFHTTKEGFDFSIYDKQHNRARLYNYYLGSVGILNGDTKIENIHKKLKLKKKEWKQEIQSISSSLPANSDYIVEKKQLTVAGEFQFGNWALVYRDLFRLLNADSNPGIDFYIYITASNTLSNLISSNTVSYDKAIDVIEENLSIIKTPIWVIGLDIKK